VVLLLLGAGVDYLLKPPPSNFPPVLVVSVSSSQGPLRVFPGANGALFLLPDGSLWRWGQTGVQPMTAVPEPYGTNRDWVRVETFYEDCVGLRSDGTIWGQRMPDGKFSGDLNQLDPETNWTDITTRGGYAYGIKKDGTLWGWGRYRGQSGASSAEKTNIVQIGTDADWATVRSRGASTLAIKRDGTLWAWGQTYSPLGTSPINSQRFPKPFQVCRETNWVELVSGFAVLARNSSGQLWEPFYGPLNEQSAAAANCQLVSTNPLPNHVAFSFNNQLRVFDLHADGTLWERNLSFPISVPILDPGATWRQVGKRRDWISIWSGASIAYGLTADGTVWTWGADPTQLAGIDFLSKLKLVQSRFVGKGTPAFARGMNFVPHYLKEPRPLFQLEPANAK
jgi:alpha-tubulin suppressor-like RCC1 family protein